LHLLHLTGVSAVSIIETVQVQEAMHDVQAKFADERISEDPSVMLGCLDADEDFAMVKRQYVRRSRLIEELPMQRRHSTIGDKQNENLAQPC
jgi:hypothetical protein